MKDEFVLQYYKEQAEQYQESWQSTMRDEIVRKKEIQAISEAISDCTPQNGSVMDIGCGNGYTTEIIAKEFPRHHITGIDVCDDLLKIAGSRKVQNCTFSYCDVQNMSKYYNTMNFIYTERCVINIRDVEYQKIALKEISRVLKVGGVYLMIEAFMDGHENYNKARTEFDLEPIPLPKPNLFFKKDILDFMGTCDLERIQRDSNRTWQQNNFLSSHYFMARVIHPLLCKKEVRNSEFVKFFDAALPPVGNYSPVQVFAFRKK